MHGLFCMGELTSDYEMLLCSSDCKMGFILPSSRSGNTLFEKVAGTCTSPLIKLNELVFLLF